MSAWKGARSSYVKVAGWRYGDEWVEGSRVEIWKGGGSRYSGDVWKEGRE